MNIYVGIFLSLFSHLRLPSHAGEVKCYRYGWIMAKLGVVGGFGAPSVCLCFLGGAAVAGGPQKTC